jgi:hypothetical protein
VLARLIRGLLIAPVFIFVVCFGMGPIMPGGASGGATTPPAQAASSGPACTFNGSTLPLITGVSAGSNIALSCTGLSPLHPYMLVGTSLVLAIDPAAAPLFSGQITSLSALMGLLAALKEIDLASAATHTSDLSGDMSVNWTVPTYQAADPNASCPPTQEEFNSGLLGCALAMIDLTSFTPVGAGSALFEYAGFPFLPPAPTVALSAGFTVPNQAVSVRDAPGATTYWWLATLAVLESALGPGSSGSPPAVAVSEVDQFGHSVAATTNAMVAPAKYSGGVFTPPALSGNFTVPSTITGAVTVNVVLTAPLDGIPLASVASAPGFVDNPPTTSVVLPSNGASLTGGRWLDAVASDYGKVTKVEYRLTGGTFNKTLIATGTSTAYGWIAGWDTTTVPDGSYTLQSVAYDAAGLSTYSAGVPITVDNPPPTTSVLVPSSGATLSGSQWLDASASGNVAVNKVEFHLTGGSLNDVVVATGTPTYYGWLGGWNTATVANGTYTLQSVAYDASGNVGRSTPITITVSN